MKTQSKILSMILVIALVMMVGLTTVALTACGGEKNILVISREDGSGTRDAFDGLVKSTDGDKLSSESVTFVETAEYLSKTGDVMVKVAANTNALGYISLGSLDDSITALTVGGVEATAENVIDGTYSMSRPFVIMTNASVTLQSATSDFHSFLQTADAQEIVEGDYVQNTEMTATYTAPTVALTGTVNLCGSTSVQPLMEELVNEYKDIAGSMVSGVTFSLNCTGSSAGVSGAATDTTGNTIGMSSSAVTSSNDSYNLVNQFDIARDAIAVVVNNDNDYITDISSTELFDIYTGAVTTFSEVVANREVA